MNFKSSLQSHSESISSVRLESSGEDRIGNGNFTRQYITRRNSKKGGNVVKKGATTSSTKKATTATAAQVDDTTLFPVKLYDLLEDAESDETIKAIISWHPNGTEFKVHNKEKFETLIQPKYFRQSKHSSFRRQLNLWKFKRIPGGYYSYPTFQRGDRDACHEMKRVKVKSSKPIDFERLTSSAAVERRPSRRISQVDSVAASLVEASVSQEELEMDLDEEDSFTLEEILRKEEDDEKSHRDEQYMLLSHGSDFSFPEVSHQDSLVFFQQALDFVNGLIREEEQEQKR